MSAAIGAMFLLRCLHPPGGATALLAVLTQASSLEFVLFPVLVNSVLLALVGFYLTRSVTGPSPTDTGPRGPSSTTGARSVKTPLRTSSRSATSRPGTSLAPGGGG